VNIYFACSLTGGRKDQSVYARIVDSMLAAGHDVPTAHLSREDVMDLEQRVVAEEIYKRDMNWIRACDAVVAEVSTPSHGVGYEIAAALARGKPVLCCYRRNAKVSKMITGNRTDGLSVKAYNDADHAVDIVAAFLAELSESRNE
jgi:nucleoside 2-deoxyribosyltransferase